MSNDTIEALIDSVLIVAAASAFGIWQDSIAASIFIVTLGFWFEWVTR